MQFCRLKEYGECEIQRKMPCKHFQVMDFIESRMDNAQPPPDAEVLHRTTRHDAGKMLSTHFHDTRCSGAPSGVWESTHGDGLPSRRTVSDSQSLMVRQLTHS